MKILLGLDQLCHWLFPDKADDGIKKKLKL
jgi:hypothetical protein